MKRQLIGDVLSSLIQDKEQSIYHSLTPTPILIQSHHASIGANIWTDYWDKTKKMSASAQNKIKEWVVWAISIIDDSCQRVYNWLSSIKTSVLTNIPLAWLTEFTELANDMVSVSKDTLNGIFETFGRFIRRLFGKTFGLFKNVNKSVLYDAYQQLISLVKVPISLVGNVMIQPLIFIGEWLRDFIAPTLLQGTFKIVKTHVDIIMYSLHAMIRQDEPRVLRLMTLRERYFNEKMCENIANVKHQVARRVEILSDFCTELVEIAQVYRDNADYRLDGFSTRINWNVKSVWLLSLHNPKNSNPQPINSISDFLWVISDFLYDAVTQNHDTALFYAKQIMEHPVYYHIGKLVYDNICTTLSPLESMFNNKDDNQSNVVPASVVHKKQGYTEERFANIVNNYTRRLAVSQNPLVVQKLKDMREFLEAFKTTGVVEISEEERTAWVEQYTSALKEHHKMMLSFRKKQRQKEEIAISRQDLDELDDDELSELLLVDSRETMALSIIRLDLLAMDGIRIKHNKYLMDDLLRELIITAEHLIKVASFAPSKLAETVMPEKKKQPEQRRPSKKKRQGRTGLRYTDVNRQEAINHLLDVGQIKKVYKKWVETTRDNNSHAWDDEIQKATNLLNDGYSAATILIFDTLFRVEDIKALDTFQGRYGATYYYFLEAYRRLYPLLQKGSANFPQSSSNATQGVQEELLVYLSDIQMAFKQYDRIKWLINQNNRLFIGAALFGLAMWGLETGMRASGRLKAVINEFSPADAKIVFNLSTKASKELDALREASALDDQQQNLGFLLSDDTLGEIQPLLQLYSGSTFEKASRTNSTANLGLFYSQTQIETALSAINYNVALLNNHFDYLDGKTSNETISNSKRTLYPLDIAKLKIIDYLSVIRQLTLEHFPTIKKQTAAVTQYPKSKVEWFQMFGKHQLEMTSGLTFNTSLAEPISLVSVKALQDKFGIGNQFANQNSWNAISYIMAPAYRAVENSTELVASYDYLYSAPALNTPKLITDSSNSTGLVTLDIDPDQFFTQLMLRGPNIYPAINSTAYANKTLPDLITNLKSLPIMMFYDVKQVLLEYVKAFIHDTRRSGVRADTNSVQDIAIEANLSVEENAILEQYSRYLDRYRFEYLKQKHQVDVKSNSIPLAVQANDDKIVNYVCDFIATIHNDFKDVVAQHNSAQYILNELSPNIDETIRVRDATRVALNSYRTTLETARNSNDETAISLNSEIISDLSNDLLRYDATIANYEKLEKEAQTYQLQADIINLLSGMSDQTREQINNFYSDRNTKYRDIIDLFQRNKIQDEGALITSSESRPEVYQVYAQRYQLAYEFIDMIKLNSNYLPGDEDSMRLVQALLTFIDYRYNKTPEMPKFDIDNIGQTLARIYTDDVTMKSTAQRYRDLVVSLVNDPMFTNITTMNENTFVNLGNLVVDRAYNIKNKATETLREFMAKKSVAISEAKKPGFKEAIERTTNLDELTFLLKEQNLRGETTFQSYNIFMFAGTDVANDKTFFKKFNEFEEKDDALFLKAEVTFSDAEITKLFTFFNNTASVAIASVETIDYIHEMKAKTQHPIELEKTGLFVFTKDCTNYANMLSKMVDAVVNNNNVDKESALYKDVRRVQSIFKASTAFQQDPTENAMGTRFAEVFKNDDNSLTSVAAIDSHIRKLQDTNVDRSFKTFTDHLDITQRAIRTLESLGPLHAYNYQLHILRGILSAHVDTFKDVMDVNDSQIRDRIDTLDVDFLEKLGDVIETVKDKCTRERILFDNSLVEIKDVATKNMKALVEERAKPQPDKPWFYSTYSIQDIKQRIADKTQFAFKSYAIPLVNVALSINSFLSSGVAIYNFLQGDPVTPINTATFVEHGKEFQIRSKFTSVFQEAPVFSSVPDVSMITAEQASSSSRIGATVRPLVASRGLKSIDRYSYDIGQSIASYTAFNELEKIGKDFNKFLKRLRKDINQLWEKSTWWDTLFKTEVQLVKSGNGMVDNLHVAAKYVRIVLAMIGRFFYTAFGTAWRQFNVIAAIPMAVTQLQIAHFIMQCVLGGTTALGWTEGVYDWEFDTYLSAGGMALSGLFAVLFMGIDRIFIKNTWKQALDKTSMDQLGNVIFAEEPRLTGHEGPQMAWRIFRGLVGPLTEYANGIQEWVFLPSTVVSGSNTTQAIINQSASSWVESFNTSIPELFDMVLKAPFDPNVIKTVKTTWYSMIHYAHWSSMGVVAGKALWNARKQMQGTQLVDLLPTIYYNIVYYMQRFTDKFIPVDGITKHGSGKPDLTSATGILTHYGILWANQNTYLYRDLNLIDKLENFVFVINNPVSGVGSRYEYPPYVVLMPDIINTLHTSQYTSNDFARLKDTLDIPVLSTVPQPVAVLHEILINEGAFVEQALRLAETPEQKYEFLLTIIAKYAGKYIIQNLINEQRK